MAGRVAVFGPSPLLSVTIERRAHAADQLHLHPAGQGVWVARMAGELGAAPVLCALAGGETGAVLATLLERMPGERRLIATAADSGSYVTDRRSGQRRTVAMSPAEAPSRHEVDALVSAAAAEALGSAALAVCNPLPGDALPLGAYDELVADVAGNGVPVLVDLSTPRLEHAARGRPELVKINDWELAEWVYGPVSAPAELRAAVDRLAALGPRTVVVTRGAEPAFVLRDGQAWELAAPRFEHGHREGCGDAMLGAIAAGYAEGLGWEERLRLGAAAGAANFLRHGLGSAARRDVEALFDRVTLTPAS